MATELKDDATHDDIQNYVDEAIKNVEADRAGEEKTDAQKIASDSDKPIGDMTAETSGSAQEKTADEGDDTSESEGQEKEWLDDKLKAEVAAYGIDEKEIAEFTSREELDRALRLFDRKALDAGRKALAESDDTGKTRDEKGRFVPKTQAKDAKAEETESPAADGRYEIGLSKDDFDDRLVGELTRMRDHYESRLEALESRFLESDAKAEESRFDAAVDSLSMPKLFGKTGSESADELQRRKDLMVQVKAQQIGLRQLTGRDVELDALVARVAPMVFSEEFDKQKLKSRTRKISQQSNGRQGGGATRPTDAPETVRDEMRRLYKELEQA